MNSGRIAVVNENGNLSVSDEFNGRIGPFDFGSVVLELLKKVNTLGDFYSFLLEFNDRYGYHNDDPLFGVVPGEWYNTRYNYNNKWHSDYVYIKNLSLETRYFVTPDGFVALPPNEVLTLHFGKLIKEDKLAYINIGDIVTVANIDWIVLEKSHNSIFCLTKNSIDSAQFDPDSPNYAESELRKKLQCFAKNIKDKIGEKGIFSREIELITNEDKLIYKPIIDELAPLTDFEFTRFYSIIQKYPLENWWWLATADSRWDTAVCCIDWDNLMDHHYCGSSIGVRPACIFSSEVFK